MEIKRSKKAARKCGNSNENGGLIQAAVFFEEALVGIAREVRS